MNFRNYGGLEPVVVTAKTPKALERKLRELAEGGELVDLQYSTDGGVYSALALVRPFGKATRGGAGCSR